MDIKIPTEGDLVLKIPQVEVDLVFRKYELTYDEKIKREEFVKYNDSTLGNIITKPRYKTLIPIVLERYNEFLDLGIGTFLLNLKKSGDCFYKEFLGPYGDEAYCDYSIKDESIKKQKGIYAYGLNTIMYIGRCRDSFKKRIDNGYGKISPYNCLKLGQSTNCRLNFFVTSNRPSFWVATMDNPKLIAEYEEYIRDYYHLPWNIR
jgi:hypothetical protein